MKSLEQLVLAAQSGQRDAFGELVERYQRAATATAWAVLLDFHGAQDIAQDSFLIAFEQLHTLRNTATFGPWLLTIVRREALRVSKRASPIPTSLGDSDERTPDIEMKSYDTHEDLVQSIARLSEHEREVVVFHYLDGYSTSEISEFTGRPIGTITKQLSRAIERLRQTLRQVPQ